MIFIDNLLFFTGSWGIFPLVFFTFLITAIKVSTIESRKEHHERYNDTDFKDTNLLLFFLVSAFFIALIFATILTIFDLILK